ncbi:hypothetical protein GA0115240_14041, partial [Streptomyces sp. DvalAA-14]|uniref:LAETG motif-containing sortase-dependent surface protein n=1 Tax=unclassified Streptomyces TaxID=2593676 RepID=UPI00081B00C4
RGAVAGGTSGGGASAADPDNHPQAIADRNLADTGAGPAAPYVAIGAAVLVAAGAAIYLATGRRRRIAAEDAFDDEFDDEE